MRAGRRHPLARAWAACVVPLLVALGSLLTAPVAFAGKAEHGFDVAIQANGKIVMAGDSDSAGTGDFALARYNADGSLDPTFSGDGRVTTDFGGSDSASAVAIQPNGKIVAAGYAPGGFAVARYNADGSLDRSFSDDGMQTTDFGSPRGVAEGVAVQPDGRIVVAGWTGNASNDDDMALARFNANGSLDSSFSGDGRQTTAFGAGNQDYANDVAVQANGKLVLAGYTFNQATGPEDFALARFSTDGSLDASFSGDGKLTTGFTGPSGDRSDTAWTVAVQPDGKIVAAGASGAYGVALARYGADGSLDPSFSDDGRATTSWDPLSIFASTAEDVAIQPDGGIVAAGNENSNWALARYRIDGSLDPSFSGDGLQYTAFGDFSDAAAVALQPDGKVVAGGNGNGFHRDFALARYGTDGSLDPSFSGDGRQTTDFGGTNDTDGDGVPDSQDSCPTQPGPRSNHGCPKQVSAACVKARAKLADAKNALEDARSTHNRVKIKRAKKRVRKAKHAVRAAC